MGYDVCISHDGDSHWVGSMTWNVKPMFVRAMGDGGIHVLEGLPTEEAVPLLDVAIERMADPKQKPNYEALNPPNGWGSYDTALKFLCDIRRECHHRRGRVEIH